MARRQGRGFTGAFCSMTIQDREIRVETTLGSVHRHLRNGYVILTTRGAAALYGAAMREAAKLVDSPAGPSLSPRRLLRDGRIFVEKYGFRATMGALLRQAAEAYDPPRRSGATDPAKDAFAHELVWPNGVTPARRPADEADFAIEVPLAFDAPAARREAVAVIIHAYYVELAPLFVEKASNIPGLVDLYLSTDTPEKRRILESVCRKWRKGRVEIRIVPNRGRDIAAKFLGFRDVYEKYDLFLHLHTKRSPHGGLALARWRDYLLDSLLGSREIAQSILTLFDDRRLGVVFPQHLFDIRGVLNWGRNYDHARGLMNRMGVEIDKNVPLEFPSGSMFWGRSAAFRPFLDLDLDFDDFPQEIGQIDGTLAHAVERCVLMVAEKAGFEWLKVARRDLYPLPTTLLRASSREELAMCRLKVFRPCLGGKEGGRPASGLRETRPLVPYPSRRERPRLNLLTPTVNPRETFGGVATALRFFTELAESLGAEYDRRIVVTDSEIEPASSAAFADYERAPFVPSLDRGDRLLVDASKRGDGWLDIRANDLFVATAWWTARLAQDLEADRARLFGGALPWVYLIQDDEAHFYARGARFALAESTYRSARNAIAVINSEELYFAMREKYAFHAAWCLPYTINPRIRDAIRDQPRERLLLVYGRPSVSRNAFELICDGLYLWQQRDPNRASRWRILFLGEDFPESLLFPLQNAAVGGKASPEDYALLLGRASVGVSLMLSPHPSYPPLEMAEAGLLTIANAFEGKDPARRADNIVLLDSFEPAAMARAVEHAVAAAEHNIGKIVSRAPSRAPGLSAPMLDMAALAEKIRGLRAMS
jgi:hypothetical protein